MAVSAPANALAVDVAAGAPAGVSATPVALHQQLPLPDVPLPDVPLADVPLPVPDLPNVPPVPELPDVPLPLPEVEAPVPTPVPVRTPAPGGNPDPVSDGPAASPVSTATSPSRSPGPAAPSANPRAATGRTGPRAPAARRRARRAANETRRAANGTRRARSTRPPSRAAAPVATVLASGDAEAPTVRRRAPERPGTATRLLDDVGELIEAMPAALLWSLIGIVVIALGMTGNAYWQSRQRGALAAQRAELLEDVGLLSSALLPPVPDAMERLIVSAAYRPADGPAAGGDFYDVFPLDRQRLGILLGDVSGHGRDSLTQAALARYTLRTLLGAGHGPGEALARADRLLARDLAPHFVTVIAAVYDETRDELTYAKAGHAPPIVLGMAHDPDAEVPACPLGLGLGDDWPEFSLVLDDDALVCLYTDGLEDARLHGVRLGRDQVTRLLAAQRRPDAEQLIADIGTYADRMPDDTAAVVLRRR